MVLPARAAETTGADGPAWAERVQIVYSEKTRSVERRSVRVRDLQPEKNLDFTWEPEGDPEATIGPDGTVSGRGKLVWRVRGSASYDPRSVFSVYVGDLVQGLFEGRGRLELRSGEFFDGEWLAGRMHGRGIHLDPAGNRYEGAFVDGRPEGEGRLMLRSGEIFEGEFRAGIRHGQGTTILPGGTRYLSTWENGREAPGARPDAVADARVGGLVRAQAGGDADRVELSTVVDERMNQESSMQYQHLVREDDVAIYPTDEEMNNAWNGTASISNGYIFSGIDWESAPAFVEVGLSTSDGSRVRLDGLELQVSASDAYRKPMLSLESHLGCVGFRPTFSFLNNGWGPVREGKVTFSFAGDQGKEGPMSRSFTRPVAGFDNGTDVNIEDVIAEAGADTVKLAAERFSCPSIEGIAVCRSQVFNTVGFGELADYVWGEDKLFTTAVGTFDYSWADDAGTVYQQSEPFQVDIALTTIEVPDNLAECGDGFGGAPEAARYQDVDLPINRRDYVVDMPLRGNKNLREYTARLKMHSQMTSFHQFQVVARLADGSERRSKPVSLYYFRPRVSDYQSQVQLPVCYLDPTGGGC